MASESARELLRQINDVIYGHLDASVNVTTVMADGRLHITVELAGMKTRTAAPSEAVDSIVRKPATGGRPPHRRTRYNGPMGETPTPEELLTAVQKAGGPVSMTALAKAVGIFPRARLKPILKALVREGSVRKHGTRFLATPVGKKVERLAKKAARGRPPGKKKDRMAKARAVRLANLAALRAQKANGAAEPATN